MKIIRYRGVLIMLLLIIIGVMATACESPSSSLVGKWQFTQAEGYIEFFSDGKFEVQDEDGNYTGTYEETGDKQITLTLELDSQLIENAFLYPQRILEYSISGNELKLSDSAYCIRAE